MEIIYSSVSMPVGHTNYIPVNLSRETMEEHCKKVLEKMKEKALDVLWFTVIVSMVPIMHI